ncbi:MAG: winged helix-turn-helix transcriptional regulator [Spirochaetes bacterium]|nr:winged helix-turn-helix transcriptional regulator [Spirochaetota bacterium]
MDAKRMARVMKALSHPNRLELYLEILKKCEASFETECGECLVSDIMDSFKIGAPTISHHLKELASANLITTERKGKFLVARVNEDTIDEVSRLLSVRQ